MSEICNYPHCNCPFDMGPDERCLRNLPRKSEMISCEFCEYAFSVMLGRYGCPNCLDTGVGTDDEIPATPTRDTSHP